MSDGCGGLNDDDDVDDEGVGKSDINGTNELKIENKIIIIIIIIIIND